MSNLHKNTISSPSTSNPLFSTIITLYTLILLYFPTAFLFSPVFLSASFLLLSLLRLHATLPEGKHKGNEEKSVSGQPSLSLFSRDNDHDYKGVSRESIGDFNTEPDLDFDPDPFYTVDSSTEQDVEFDPNTNLDPVPLSNESYVGSSSERHPKFDLNMQPDPDSLDAESSSTERDMESDPDTKPEPFPLSNEPNVESSTEKDPEIEPKTDSGSFSAESFIEWNVRAPLEVIDEEYEGEEEIGVIEKYASLSLYYPDTDSGTDSSSGGDSPVIGNWDTPANRGFRWEEEEEEEREGLIEIELDGKGSNSEAEEENLIEIDLNFPAR